MSTDPDEPPRAVGIDRAVGGVVGIVLGAVVGVATSYAQAHLSGVSATLANAASPWLLGAFAAALVASYRLTATLTGLVACAVEVAAYYVTTAARGYAFSHAEIVFWTACALIGGPVFGWAAWTWRRGRRPWWRAGAAAFPGATFLGEAFGAYLLRLHYEAQATLFACIGLLCLVIVAVPRAVRWRVAGPAIVLTGLATLLYGPVLGAVSL